MVYAVNHAFGVSLIRARTGEAAVRRAQRQFGLEGAPYRLAPDQESAIAWAKSFNAMVIE